MPFKLKLKKSRHYSVVSKSLFVLTVELLDGTSIECTLSSESTGQECLDVVCQKLGLNQPKFFGLQYMGRSNSRLEAGTGLIWLELDRPIKRQLDKHARGLCVFVRVMYYVRSGVKLLTDEVTRNHYFLQLKMDVIDGRISCTPPQAIELASYCMQAEFGNFDVERHTAHYLKDFQLFPKDLTDPNLLETLTEAASRQHASLHNTPQSIAEEHYICACQRLGGYGQERYHVKDRSGDEVCIKVAINGVRITYSHKEKEDKVYEWTDISNVINHKRDFTIESVTGSSDTKADFHFTDADTAKSAWRFCILQHQFYRQFETEAVIGASAATAANTTGGSNVGRMGVARGRAMGVGSYDDIATSQLVGHNSGGGGQYYHHQQQVTRGNDLSTTTLPSISQRAQSTSCLDLNAAAALTHLHTATSTPGGLDRDPRSALLPSYRPAPDYETALVQQQQRQQHQQQSRYGAGQQHRPWLYSSQPEIHSGAGMVQQQICYPDVTHNNVEQRQMVYGGVPAGLYAQSQLLVADHQRNMVDLVENIRLMHLNNNNTKPSSNGNPAPPPPPYHPITAQQRINSNSTPDLAAAAGSIHSQYHFTAMRQQQQQQQHQQHQPYLHEMYGNGNHLRYGVLVGSSPDLVSVQQHQSYAAGVARSHSYLPSVAGGGVGGNTGGTYENLAQIFDGQGQGNVGGNGNNGNGNGGSASAAAVIVENPNITKHIRKVYDEHGNIIYCMPANMKQILEDNQLQGATPFVVRRSAQNMVPGPIAAERHKSSTEPIYENIPFPPYDQSQMRARTQSIQSAPPEIVIGGSNNPATEGLYANIKDVRPTDQIDYVQQQQQGGLSTIITIGGGTATLQHGLINDTDDANVSNNGKIINSQASLSSSLGPTSLTQTTSFDAQSTTESDVMSRTNTFIVNRSANASVKSSSGDSIAASSTPSGSANFHPSNSSINTSVSSTRPRTPITSAATSHQLSQQLSPSALSISSHDTTAITTCNNGNSSSTTTSTVSTTSSGKKKKHRWGAILLGRGHSSSASKSASASASDSEEKVKSATLGRRDKERSGTVPDSSTGGGGDGQPGNRHRWSTGLSKLHQHHPLPPSISKETMCQLLENKLLDNELSLEFEKIPKRKWNAECNTALLPENAAFNRFPDFVPYEDNRLRLTPTKDNRTGYFNASHITATVGSKQRFYIAAQGPTRNTLPYFWQCVWETEVYLIVQLTDLNADFHYLPDAKERCINIGQEYQVWWEFSQKTGHSTTSKVRLCHVTSRRYRTLWHLHYTDWGEANGNAENTEADCPTSVPHALVFLEHLRSVQRHSITTEIPILHNSNPPVLVHCSSPVNRTGLIILCDLLLYTIDHNQEVDIPRVVGLLRQQRAYLVQTLAQYRFVHMFLVHYLRQTRLI